MNLSKIGKWYWLLYSAWLNEGGNDRLLLGGILLSMFAAHLITLDAVLTASDTSEIAPALYLLLLLIFWYILRPLKVYRRAEAEATEAVNE